MGPRAGLGGWNHLQSRRVISAWENITSVWKARIDAWLIANWYVIGGCKENKRKNSVRGCLKGQRDWEEWEQDC